MSAILSYFSSASVYQAVDRNSFAHSSEAVGGARQAFAENDEEASHGDHRHDYEPDETPAMTAAQKTAPASAAGHHRYILNVTA